MQSSSFGQEDILVEKENYKEKFACVASYAYK